MTFVTYHLPKTLVSVVAACLILFAGSGRIVQAGPTEPPIAPASQLVPLGQTGSAKISPELLAAMKALPPGDMLTVIVTLGDQVNLSQLTAAPPGGRNRAARLKNVITQLQSKADVSQRALKMLLNTRRAESRVGHVEYFWIFNGFGVTATPDVIQELAARPEVAQIRANRSIQAPAAVPESQINALSVPEANLQLINAPALWNLGYTGQGIVVANMDTGVDISSQPDLANTWRGGANSWYDPFGEFATPNDFSGHGTWTMGVMVGNQHNGKAYGMAPGAQWIAAKIFPRTGLGSSIKIHQAYQWMLDPDNDPNTPDAPHVINNSWVLNSLSACDTEFRLDLQNLRAAGILPVFSAGNDPLLDFSPANNPEAFAVGATDNNDAIYFESSRGRSSCDGTFFPEIVAPGVNIYTTDLFGLFTDTYHGRVSGTSLAAPHVAGALALLLSAAPQLTVDEQEAALLAGVVDLGTPGPDTTFGNGRLDVLASLQSLGDVDLAITQMAAPNPVLVDSSLNYSITVNNHGPVTATVVTLTNTLPAGMLPGSITPSQGSCGLPVGDVFTCTLGSLPGSASAAVTLVITPTTGGITITNTSVVSATEKDFNTGNNTSAANTPVLTEFPVALFLPLIVK